MNFKAVIFDMDGVIFDSERLIYEGWLELASKYGFSGLEELYPQCAGVNDIYSKKIFLDRYGEDFPYDLYQQEVTLHFNERYGGGRLPLKPGVEELLKYLNEKQYLVGLASSTVHAAVLPEIRDAGLLPYFTDLTCGDMVNRSKPEPDIFLRSCENLGIKPPEALVIEDSYNGIRAAHRAGAVPVMVPDMLEPDDEMRHLASHIFSSLSEVKVWLRSLE